MIMMMVMMTVDQDLLAAPLGVLYLRRELLADLPIPASVMLYDAVLSG
jgi:hypothetical protein